MAGPELRTLDIGHRRSPGRTRARSGVRRRGACPRAAGRCEAGEPQDRCQPRAFSDPHDRTVPSPPTPRPANGRLGGRAARATADTATRRSARVGRVRRRHPHPAARAMCRTGTGGRGNRSPTNGLAVGRYRAPMPSKRD
ncbi:hypothetical protein KCH_00420 [Kitasatospora cheerisanensis KCTC 2395]|uniref:Uncharacterized protein n=1 Tax=Kitasatospora cheerisanensis KCTC 2395 TaxID=1348663 RepID=A0A066Z404_9ACTN|nr:hypothetical protein KCH_00420 [Kitasatospora cheerisanensis KCTC 2395]